METPEKHPILKRILIFCAVTYLSALVVVMMFQRRMIFFPSQELPNSRYVPWVESGTQIGWKKAAQSPRHIWLFLHGNKGNVLTRDFIIDHTPPEDFLYAVEYPGYGFRDGSPSKLSIDRAAEEAFDALRRKYTGIPIIVVGESIGSGPACHLAGQPNPPEKIILAVPFDNLPSVAQDKTPLIPAKWMLVDRWDNIEALRGYKGKLEIISAEDDKVIKVRHARKLFKAYPDAEYQELVGTAHKDWWKSVGILSAE
jgi:uncharacterized protein